MVRGTLVHAHRTHIVNHPELGGGMGQEDPFRRRAEAIQAVARQSASKEDICEYLFGKRFGGAV